MGNKSSKKAQDIEIIVLLGPTGAGKSTFANTAAGRRALSVGDTLGCCTRTVQLLESEAPGSSRRVMLVDTPAFNHDTLPISDVEKMITKRLKDMYSRKFRVAGIVYLHRITDVRMNENPIHHLDSFQKLCGEEKTVRRIILATTMWGLVKENEGRRREAELGNTAWKGMKAQGSRIMRFQDSRESAWEIIDALLQRP